MKAALFFEDDQLCHLGENMGKKAIKVSTITTEDDKIISIKNSEVKNSDYYKLWSNESDMTQIQINEDGTYLFDHYTASSEVKGTYKINGTNIIFTDENGTEWNGTMRREEAGNFALKISKNGEKVTLYDGEGD